MPRETFLVSAEWKAWVRSSLSKMPRGAQTRLAERCACGTGQLSELLKPEARTSHLVPAIERALLEMGAPRFEVATESDTIRYLVERASDEQRKYLLDVANMLLHEPTSQATRALTKMLESFRAAIETPTHALTPPRAVAPIIARRHGK